MAKDLKKWLIDWYSLHHFHMMPKPILDRWKDMRGDDKTADVVTYETQARYREFLEKYTQIDGKEKKISVTLANLARIRQIAGNDKLKVGDEFKIKIDGEQALKDFVSIGTPKIGEKVFWYDVRSGGQKGWGVKNSQFVYSDELIDGNKALKDFLSSDKLISGAYPKFSELDQYEQQHLIPVVEAAELADRPYPKFSDLEPADQQRFYRIVRDTLRRIKDDAPTFTDPDNPPKVDTFLGADKAFSMPIAPDDIKEKISALRNFIENNTNLQIYLKTNPYSKVFSDDYTYDEFLRDSKDKDFWSNNKFRQKLEYVIGGVNSWSETTAGKDINDLDLDSIVNALDSSAEEIDPVKFAQFASEIDGSNNFQKLLESFYDTSKDGKKSAFYNDFANHGGSLIVNPMTEVVDQYKYDKLTPKYKDKRTWFQTQQKKVKDFKEDHISKLWKRHLRHNYIEPNARNVVDIILDNEISPSDGLKKILEKKDAITKRLEGESDSGTKGFKYFCEVLGKINDSGTMKKAFAGALKNGKQCNAIAQEIIRDAVSHQPTRMGEARVALEVLAVMRYDTFDSKRAKDFLKEKFDPFKDASFMKNTAIKTVVNAATGLLNLGIKGFTWGAIAVRNKLQHRLGKISDKEAEAIKKSMDKIKENSDRFTTLEKTEEELKKRKKARDEHDAKYASEIVEYNTLKNKSGKTSEEETKLQKLEVSPNIQKHFKVNAEVNVAQELYDYQQKKKLERHEKETENSPAIDPNTDLEDVDVLTMFWNAANGYDREVKVNDYNPFKKHDDKVSNKAKFNLVAVKRLEQMREEEKRRLMERHKSAA
jgi:hypothetical protein